MVSPDQKRRACVYLKKKMNLSERRACALLGLYRTTLRYRPTRKPDSDLRAKIKEIARQHPRMGCQQAWGMLRGQGEIVNIKKVHRIWKEEGLQVGKRKRPRRRKKFRSLPVEADFPGHVWSYDFIHDRIYGGKQLKILVILDEKSRVLVGFEVGYSIGSERVKQVLERAFKAHGKPKFIRSDNGPEFIAKALRKWFEKENIGPVYIEPGKPWQNPYIESFNGKLRDNCLSQEVFLNLVEARTLIGEWIEFYNTVRPHSSLANCAPEQYARSFC